MRLQLEALSRFDPDDKHVTHDLLDSLILEHRAQRLLAQPQRDLESSQGAMPAPKSRPGRKASA